jgi:hypothetical protein
MTTVFRSNGGTTASGRALPADRYAAQRTYDRLLGRYDALSHDIQLCIWTGKRWMIQAIPLFVGPFYLRTPRRCGLSRELPEALTNTLLMRTAVMCRSRHGTALPDRKYKIPAFRPRTKDRGRVPARALRGGV